MWLRAGGAGNDVNALEFTCSGGDAIRRWVRLNTKATSRRCRRFGGGILMPGDLSGERGDEGMWWIDCADCAGGFNGWKARYFDAEHGGQDITAAVTGAGW